MNKPEVIYLAEANAIDVFAPERAGPPPRPETTEPTDDFAAEVSLRPLPVSPVRSSVPFPSRRRFHAMTALVSVGVVAVAASFVVWLWGGAGSRLISPSEPPAMTSASSALPPVLQPSPPPAVVDTPSPITAAPAPTYPAPVIPSNDPPSAAPSVPTSRGLKDLTGAGLKTSPSVSPNSPGVVSKTPPSGAIKDEARVGRPQATQTPAVRLERPLSQDPGRLVEVPAPSPPPNPSPSVTASPPAATAAPAPPPAPLTAEVSPPAAAPPRPAAAPPVAPPAAAPAAAAASAIESSTAAIRNTLARYEEAFTALDANAAREVWPTVNTRNLSRAFERLEEQEVAFEGCQIKVADARAEATCQGTARYVPRIGDRTPRVDQREWHFSLVKTRDEWLIGAVDAR